MIDNRPNRISRTNPNGPDWTRLLMRSTINKIGNVAVKYNNILYRNMIKCSIM